MFCSKLNLKIENQRIKSSKVSKQKRKRVFCCLHCVVISVFKNKSMFSFQTRKEHKGNCPHARWGVDSINVSSHVKFSRFYNLITPDITTSYNLKVQPSTTQKYNFIAPKSTTKYNSKVHPYHT